MEQIHGPGRFVVKTAEGAVLYRMKYHDMSRDDQENSWKCSGLLKLNSSEFQSLKNAIGPSFPRVQGNVTSIKKHQKPESRSSFIWGIPNLHQPTKLTVPNPWKPTRPQPNPTNRPRPPGAFIGFCKGQTVGDKSRLIAIPRGTDSMKILKRRLEIWVDMGISKNRDTPNHPF